jgi:hypothetical protein
MKYQIALNVTPARLMADVAAYIADGWEPLGGVTVSSDRNTWTNERKGYAESEYSETWAQALVKRS